MSSSDQAPPPPGDDPTVPIERVPPAGGPGGAPAPTADPEAVPDAAARRRRTLVVVAAVVAVLLLGGLGAWWATRGDDGPTTATGPSPTDSAPTTSEPTTGEPTTGGPATTSPSTAATSTTAAPTTTAAPAGPATAIPAGLRLPGEGQEGYAPQGWTYQPCGQPVSAAGASDFRRVVSDQPEDSRSQSLLVFATPDAATAFLGTLRGGAEACAGPGDPGTGDAAMSLHALDGDWQEGFLAANAYPVGPAEYSPGGEYWLAVRTGTAVAVSAGYGSWAPGYPTPDPSAVAAYREPLDRLAPDLCVFTAEGC